LGEEGDSNGDCLEKRDATDAGILHVVRCAGDGNLALAVAVVVDRAPDTVEADSVAEGGGSTALATVEVSVIAVVVVGAFCCSSG
jgi:hypothetical protein